MESDLLTLLTEKDIEQILSVIRVNQMPEIGNRRQGPILSLNPVFYIIELLVIVLHLLPDGRSYALIILLVYHPTEGRSDELMKLLLRLAAINVPELTVGEHNALLLIRMIDQETSRYACENLVVKVRSCFVDHIEVILIFSLATAQIITMHTTPVQLVA